MVHVLAAAATTAQKADAMRKPSTSPTYPQPNLTDFNKDTLFVDAFSQAGTCKPLPQLARVPIHPSSQMHSFIETTVIHAPAHNHIHSYFSHSFACKVWKCTQQECPWKAAVYSSFFFNPIPHSLSCFFIPFVLLLYPQGGSSLRHMKSWQE